MWWNNTRVHTLPSIELSMTTTCQTKGEPLAFQTSICFEFSGGASFACPLPTISIEKEVLEQRGDPWICSTRPTKRSFLFKKIGFSKVEILEQRGDHWICSTRPTKRSFLLKRTGLVCMFFCEKDVCHKLQVQDRTKSS